MPKVKQDFLFNNRNTNDTSGLVQGLKKNAPALYASVKEKRLRELKDLQDKLDMLRNDYKKTADDDERAEIVKIAQNIQIRMKKFEEYKD